MAIVISLVGRRTWSYMVEVTIRTFRANDAAAIIILKCIWLRVIIIWVANMRRLV